MSEAGNSRLLSWPVARRALFWLVFLAPFFYLTYGAANWLASRRGHVGSIVYGWEHAIPFLAWTILPYWSINLFYAASLFVNDTAAGVDRLAGRYLTAQIVAVACFIAFPLQATFVRPETDGLPGFLFAVLGGFDKPYNQAPSLHVALLVIIWDHLRHRLAGAAALAWHVWCVLIGLSVLTTWQHHFIDIPTGALLGLFGLWLFPRHGPLPLKGRVWAHDRGASRLGLTYMAGALICFAAAAAGALRSPSCLILLWPALALAIVATGYFGAGPDVFQKDSSGHATVASRLLLLPYRLGARLNAWAWTRKLRPSVAIASGVHLGRFPFAGSSPEFATIVDLAAEFIRPRAGAAAWVSVPMLDLLAPPTGDLDGAAGAIEAARSRGPVLVCCALGFQRSATAIARWMVLYGQAADEDAAFERLALAGRPVHRPMRAAAGETA